MKKICLLCLFLMLPALALARVEYKIVTASERGTYIEIGRDLAKWVAAPAGIDLQVLPSKGSAENVQRLRYEPGVKLALVQSDVYQALLDQAQAGNKPAGQIIRPLRVILPLYNEEIYFVTRADSPLNFIHEMKDKKINVGPVGSGTALSATTLYRLMYGQNLPDGNASYLSNEEALLKLTEDKSIDVVVIVAGQPAKLFADMKPEARQYIKLLRLDEKAPEIQRATKIYFPAVIRSASYPNWISQDVPTLTVKAFLVTYDYNLKMTKAYLRRFADALCLNFDNLQNHGHQKWRQVGMALPPLGKGWTYYAPMAQVLRDCAAHRVAAGLPAATTQQAKKCSQQEKVLGLCGI
ncbi:TAXI family TRAP transporter solute-binding subunit [Herminiimonas sp. CN]|uniref:TAXI family TRAP transporter solute-binding subunit n=1 Tax=Herminiimonas sp. CN TaxID=1349818 RepID=UPI0004738E1A|nr:TAXI family TRAP transporter solute-binding subunit [Herminiimonas sp. CN]